MLRAIRNGGSKNTVVFGGDSHCSWVGSLLAPDNTTVAAEFDGMSVTSQNFGSRLGFIPMSLLDAGAPANNPTMVWADLHSKGYMLATLTHKQQDVVYLSVPVASEQYNLVTKGECLSAFRVRVNSNNQIEPIECTQALPLAENASKAGWVRSGALVFAVAVVLVIVASGCYVVGGKQAKRRIRRGYKGVNDQEIDGASSSADEFEDEKAGLTLNRDSTSVRE